MEHADELNAKTLPIPSEQRVDVYVVTPNAELKEQWLRAGGASNFHLGSEVMPDDAVKFCGVVLFVLENPNRVPGSLYRALRPFFEYAGSEANVFEYCPVQKNFTRRDRGYLFSRCPSDIW